MHMHRKLDKRDKNFVIKKDKKFKSMEKCVVVKSLEEFRRQNYNL